MCGRASRLTVTSPRPSPTITTSGPPRRSRAALRPTIRAALAAAAPVRSTTPLHPPRRKASVSRISASHSCAVHGAPGIEWLNGSARGTPPCAMIHSPVARCDQVSPSPRTLGEKAESANRKIAIAAKPSPARRASEAGSLSERTSGKATDISRACQSRNNAALNRRPRPRRPRLPPGGDAIRADCLKVDRRSRAARLYRPQSAPEGKPPPPWLASAKLLPEHSDASPAQTEAKLTGVDVRLAWLAPPAFFTNAV